MQNLLGLRGGFVLEFIAFDIDRKLIAGPVGQGTATVIRIEIRLNRREIHLVVMRVGRLDQQLLDLLRLHLAELVLRRRYREHPLGPAQQPTDVPLRGLLIGIDVFAQGRTDRISGLVLGLFANDAGQIDRIFLCELLGG